MDNASIHKSIFFKEKCGNFLNILYLPSYSPPLNPIERIFSLWKSYVRKKELLTEDMLAVRICEKAGLFKESDFTQNYIKSHIMLLNCLNKNNI